VIAAWQRAFPCSVVSLSYTANCDGPLPSRLCVVNQPVIRSSLEVCGPRLARLASSRAHLPPVISRSSGSTSAYSAWGCGHGGTRNMSTSRKLHTRSVGSATQVMLLQKLVAQKAFVFKVLGKQHLPSSITCVALPGGEGVEHGGVTQRREGGSRAGAHPVGECTPHGCGRQRSVLHGYSQRCPPRQSLGRQCCPCSSWSPSS